MPSLIGNKPNQVPSNGDLGTMAFREQDQFVPTSGIGSTVQAYSAQLQSYATNGVSMRNRIINGAMTISQRIGTSSITPTTDDTYSLDRWAAGINVASKFSIQQNAGSVTPPVGFTNYLGVTSLSSYTVAAGDVMVLKQTIEGFNIADLGWGTANAATVTLSFWVRSSLTGTFGGTFMNSAQNRAYPFTYTISSANTWEQKSITIVGDTTGTWVTNNGAGIKLGFQLGVGSTFTGTAGAWTASNLWGATGATSVVGTNGATFYITGVQLEKGTQATSFEYRQYGQELALCQRYYYKLKAATSFTNAGVGRAYSTTNAQAFVALPVSMRAAPTGSFSALTDWNTSGLGTPSAINAVSQYSSDFRQMSIDLTDSFISGQAIAFNANNTTNAFIDWSAEL